MAKIFDIKYGNDEKQKLDLYLQDSVAPLVFYTHGGGWWQGDKRKDTKIFDSLFSAGFSVASVNYRLADKNNPYPAQLDDCHSALTFLQQSDYKFRKDKIALLGASSGANISVSLSIETGYPTVSWSGQFDFKGFLKTHTAITGRKAVDNPDPDKGSRQQSYYKWLLEKLFNGDFSRVGEATLQHKITSKTGPVLLINSAAELAPVMEVYKMQEAYLENGIEVDTIIFPGDRHALGYADDALKPTIDFLETHLQ
ncbi:esterase [Oenococcus oeni]|uniref:alpha/beta hydrolase n=1 Tax=Oenococcus oeni TaxID=1247 RepID=UPI000BDEEA14|nr:alpha/beta hydrolase [Oenococcus oeni]PDH87375.1 esterase [Oenococcus oeni]